MSEHIAFRLDKAAIMLDKGMSARILAIGVPEGYRVQWVSDDTSTAVVGPDGTVTAVGDGNTVIRAAMRNLQNDMITAVEAQCIISVGYQGQNPYLPPVWELFIADGEPHVFEGKLYIYGSRDCPNGYMEGAPKNDWCSGDYHVIWSEDLIHWTDAGVAISIDDIPGDIRGNGTRLWAPDLFQSPRNGRYYLTFCTNGADIFIADSNSPAGPFGNVRRITMGDEPVKCIDPAVLADSGGKVYIALPFEFIIAELDPEDYSRILPETKVSLRSLIEQSDPDYYPFEGPSLRKRGEFYYYIYIASRKGEKVPTRMDYLMSKNPMDPHSWFYGGYIIETRDFIRAGNVHGSFCEFRGNWYLSYHRMAQGYQRFTRMMNLDRLEFKPDGRICEVIRTSSGAKEAFRTGETIYAASACIFSGGRDDDRFIRADKEDVPTEALPGYALVRLENEAWVGFRYVIPNDVESVTLCYRCPRSADIILKAVRKNDDNPWSVKLSLPESGKSWIRVRRPLMLPQGCLEIWLSLLTPLEPSEMFELAWFRFEAKEPVQ